MRHKLYRVQEYQNFRFCTDYLIASAIQVRKGLQPSCRLLSLVIADNLYCFILFSTVIGLQTSLLSYRTDSMIISYFTNWPFSKNCFFTIRKTKLKTIFDNGLLSDIRRSYQYELLKLLLTKLISDIRIYFWGAIYIRLMFIVRNNYFTVTFNYFVKIKPKMVPVQLTITLFVFILLITLPGRFSFFYVFSMKFYIK